MYELLIYLASFQAVYNIVYCIAPRPDAKSSSTVRSFSHSSCRCLTTLSHIPARRSNIKHYL